MAFHLPVFLGAAVAEAGGAPTTPGVEKGAVGEAVVEARGGRGGKPGGRGEKEEVVEEEGEEDEEEEKVDDITRRPHGGPVEEGVGSS